MKKIHNRNLTDLSKKLRKNMTKEERHLWYDFLKDLPVKVYRQRTFGNYIADFYCPSVKLIIELDGSQHYEEKGITDDKERDLYLSAMGFVVKRYSNYEIWSNFESVCRDIWNFIYGGD